MQAIRCLICIILIVLFATVALPASHTSMLSHGPGAHTRPKISGQLSCQHLHAVSVDTAPLHGLVGACNAYDPKVSVVIMNWKRPQNVRHIVTQMVMYDEVGEIVIMMCNEDSTFNISHPKVYAFLRIFI